MSLRRLKDIGTKSLRCLLAACFLVSCLQPSAQAAFQDLGEGARAQGMGNAFTAVADDVYAVYYNPAGLAQMERPEFSATYNKLYLGLSDGSDLGTSLLTYAQPLRNGQWGGLGVGYDRFALDNTYTENTMYLSYGRVVMQSDSGAKLMAGVSGKYLQHSFSAPPEATNSCMNGNCNNGIDPVLSGNSSKGAMDADLGVLYRFPRMFQIGAVIQHVLQPNVGFSGNDPVNRAYHLSGAYTSLWMNLASEIQLNPAPDGSMDKDFILAGEKFIPTLDRGEFGVRGSLGFGSRDWRQITMGLSYRISKIEIDYAFILPIGTISGTDGTQTVSLTFRFGSPTSEEELAQDLLEQQKRTLGPDSSLAPHDISDIRLLDVLREIQAGRFRRAYRRMEELLQELPPDPSLVRLSDRLRLISNYYPEITHPQEKWETVLLSGVQNMIRGHDHAAMLQVSYALSLDPADKLLDNFLSESETLIGSKGIRVPADSGRDLLQELLFRMEMAHNAGDYKKVFTNLQDIQIIDPNNPTGLERAGSTYYILGRYQDAIAVWGKALTLEKNQKERESLQYYLEDAARKLKGGPPPKLPATSQSAASAAEQPQPAATTAAPMPIKTGDPRDIPALYQRGVEHYARGEYLQATAMFMRILQIDPDNEQAKKALDRIRMRDSQGQ